MSLRASHWLLALALVLTACQTKRKRTKLVKDASAEAATAAANKGIPEMPKPQELPAPADVAAAPADAEKTSSGLASKVLSKGTGSDKPRAWDEVTVNYTGWTTDGKMFDSSLVARMPGQQPEPAKFPLNRVIPGWTEGVALMVEGEKRRFWIPEELAYKGQMGAPAGMLVFDVELVGFKKMPDPPTTPADVAAAPADAEKTASGLQSKLLEKGKVAKKPKATDTVKVHYTGWTTDGQLFDSSVTRNEPAVFPLDKVIKGWGEGVQLMTVGEKRRFWIPKEIAYNDRPGAPQGTLVFDIELLEIVTPETPKDVKAAPKDAEKTASGLASKVLTKGTGNEHPKETSLVKVDYTGWTTDGKMFDSSVTRGTPAEFPLNGVIKGWTEGVQLMVVGETRRFWIPEELAYGGRPGAPAGMLVFDVTLLEIKGNN
ncbi:MAG TPA: FKBP-type peptidyl-prolyl cis-trans isomerase [Polyangiales bacterium]|nr:FKBP-type peptidyl-prolyl cis-trans isomerase [Polyangiales bacterium]